MLMFLVRRVLLAIPTLFGIAVIVFLLMRAIPGDVVTNLVGLQGNVSAARLQELRRMFGLDLPVYEQFRLWLIGVLHGDLGSSLRTSRPIVQDLILRFPVTLELTLLSLAFAVAVALPSGVAAAVHRGGPIDVGVSVIALLGLSLPGFYLGICSSCCSRSTLVGCPPQASCP